MVTNSTLIFIWPFLLIILLWMMPNEKIKIIFGEIGKLLQVFPISKIVEAIIKYLNRRK